jgi:hypothetical protein
MIPEELSRRIRGGTAVPLIGAGLSRPSGISSWTELVARLRRTVEEELGEPVDQADLDLLETPRIYSQVTGSRQPLYDLLEEAVGSKFKPNPLHSLLVDLPVRTILTTNWDLLIEEAVRSRRPCNVIYDDAKVSTWREGAALQLVKFHGSVTNSSSIVFGEDDYHRFYGGHGLLLQLVRNIIATRSIVAIGFGMRDTYVKLLFGEISRLAAGTTNPHYVVVPDKTSRLQGEYVRSAGFVVVRVPTSDADPYGVEGFLRELHSSTSIFADDRRERGRLFLRETRSLFKYMGAEKIIRIRASLGPLATPDYDQDSDKQLSLFGDRTLYQQERELRNLCVDLAKNYGVRIRFMAFPFDPDFAMRKGYTELVWRERLLALQQTAEELGESLEIAIRPRGSDVNTWGVADLGHIESRKADHIESRGYDRAVLETDGAAIFRANEWFDREFRDITRLAGGLGASRHLLLSTDAMRN